jgi:hypothetical protein
MNVLQELPPRHIVQAWGFLCKDAERKTVLSKTFVPSPSASSVRKICSVIASPEEPLLVKLAPMPWAVEKECFPNVMRQVAEGGGGIVYGWALWQCGWLFIEAEHHAVWESPNGEWLDITPQVPPVAHTLFLPDKRAIYDFETTDVRDNHRLALIKDARLDRLLELFTERTALMNSIPSVGGRVTLTGDSAKAFVQNKRSIEQLSEALSSTKPLNIWQT